MNILPQLRRNGFRDRLWGSNPICPNRGCNHARQQESYEQGVKDAEFYLKYVNEFIYGRRVSE